MTNPKEKRPYELTGPAYAAWYDVGQRLGLLHQSAIAHALCTGSMKLPKNINVISATRIRQIAAGRGIIISTQ
jgi:hypothetical protein